MSVTASSPIAVTEFDVLIPYNRAPISQQTHTAFFSGAGVWLVRKVTSALCSSGAHAHAVQPKLRRFLIDGTLRAMHTAITRRTARTACSPHVAWRIDHRQRMTQTTSVTELIQEADNNVPQAVNRLFEVLYNDLYRVARNRLRADGQSLDLSATSLLHETYERLVKLNELKVTDSKQFFTYAATVMRTVVVDMARARLTERRGGGSRDIQIDTLLEAQLATPLDESVVQISEALDQLEAIEPRLARVVEMRYFSGMSVGDTATALGITLRTVGRDWIKARSLLAAILTE